MAPRKANQPQLTRDQIVAAAMRLIDEHGVEGHSMRRLGAELGADPSTIYHHVPNKDALYDLVVDEIMGSIDLSADDPSKDFQDRVVSAGWRYRTALLRHPKAVPLVAARPMRTPAQLGVIEALAGIFVDAGFRPVEVLTAMDICGMTILGMTNMHAAALVRAESHQAAAGSGEVDPATPPPERYPNLARMLGERGSLDADGEFECAMRAMATGMQALHEAGKLAPADSVEG
jgi:AcrR family transcriptional regulator